MPCQPTEKQLNFARRIAQERAEPLPPNAESDATICAMYIDTWKKNISTKPKPPTDKQVQYAQSIYAALSDIIEAREIQRALANASKCSGFIQKYKEAFNAHIEQEEQNQIISDINTMDVIPASLRQAINSAVSAKDKRTVLSAYRSAAKGFSSLDHTSLRTLTEKLTGYWLEGLQSTAFEGLGKLENGLGTNLPRQFDLEGLRRALEKEPYKDLCPDDEPTPVRHIILKLVRDNGKDTNPVVLSVLPISPVPDSNDPRGYRWGLAAQGIPKFNRNQIGEVAKSPGLLLENGDAFDGWALARVKEAESVGKNAPVELHSAFALWDESFDILTPPDGGAEMSGHGVDGWITRFMKSRHAYWQIKRLRPVFTVVDGMAAIGTTRHVAAAYHQVLTEEPTLLRQRQLALFRQVASIYPVLRQEYDPIAQAGDFEHLVRYGGHMDELKKDKRKAFPLDPAQRNALVALTMTGEGDLVAVNGPPGTGKTSLLRAVIASLWVEPLLSDADLPDCPLILACAATNQAVTNIISSFDETPGPPLFTEEGELLEGATVSVHSRWLPHMVSYGWYAPANPQKEEKYQKYQLVGRQTKQSWQFYGVTQGLNNLTVEHAEGLYLACAERYFGARLTLKMVLARLRDEVKRRMRHVVVIKAASEEWFQDLSAWASTPVWTTQDDATRQNLRGQVAMFESPRGRYEQCQVEIKQLDQALAALMSLQTNIGPTERIVGQFVSTENGSSDSDRQRYRSLKMLDHDLDAISERIIDLRRRTFIHRIMQRVLSPGDAQRELAALRAAIDACGVLVPDNGQRPDFSSWAEAVMERREMLQSELHVAAAIVLRRRMREIVTLPDDLPDTVGDWHDDLARRIEHVRAKCTALSGEMALLREQRDRCHGELRAIDAEYARYTTAQDAAHAARKTLMAAVKTLGEHTNDSQHPLDAMLEKALASYHVLDASALDEHRRDLIKCLQDWLDQHVRPGLFHLSARYWEGRYVRSRRDTLKRSKVDTAFILQSDAQLRELAMLAPVFVVTAYSAPKLMRRHLADLKDDVPPYLFGEADLLIIDEAGQGAPEVGTSAFLFAKRAIVVGDVEQLEPVWSLDEATDRLLVQRFGIIGAVDSDRDAYSALGTNGVLMANGSIMRMAQRATIWSSPTAQASGLTLSNHYRCLEPIIEVCNRMVYQGALHAARRRSDHLWRPELARLGYLAVDTATETRNPGGSRRNVAEAEIVARWIQENEASLLQHYGSGGEKKDLADIVAIVTPFKGQKVALWSALAKAYGVNKPDVSDKAALYNRIVIDTVHSMQGAERPVVIFSMVESSVPAEPQFYDKGTHLINVAISRAQDLFIVAMTQQAVDYARELTDTTLRKPSDYLWQAVVQRGSRLNARHIVVVESPNKCKTIHAAFNNSIEWEVIATTGHIVDLADPDKWNIEEASEPVWTALKPGGEKALSRLQQLWPGLATLYLATDPDPEGETIAWHVLRMLQEHQRSGQMEVAKQPSPTIKRMRFYRLESDEILRAQREASNGLDAGLVKSALARNLLDHLIAIKYPQRLGLATEPGLMAGVGRVQLGILDLVHQADMLRQPRRRIRVQIPVHKYGETLVAYVADQGKQIWGDIKSWSSVTEADVMREKLRNILDRQDLTITPTWASQLRQLPPYPAINTARLLALTYRATGMRPAQVMAELQALFEGTAQQAATITSAREWDTGAPDENGVRYA